MLAMLIFEIEVDFHFCESGDVNMRCKSQRNVNETKEPKQIKNNYENMSIG
jgi:hypothetical protein